MSRIGKRVLSIPAGVNVNVENGVVTVKGPKGELTLDLVKNIEVKVEGETVVVNPLKDDKFTHAMHGTTNSNINNMMIGVSVGYKKSLEIVGVGYRAAKAGKELTLTLGYSHPVVMIDPEGVTTELDGQNKIFVKGIDKEKVGQYAAEIRAKRGPEPYKGKGIKYSDEVIRRKVGKTGKK